MTLTNTKDGIRRTSKLLPCATAVCYFDNSECFGDHGSAWPWSAVPSREASVMHHLISLIRIDFSVSKCSFAPPLGMH